MKFRAVLTLLPFLAVPALAQQHKNSGISLSGIPAELAEEQNSGQEGEGVGGSTPTATTADLPAEPAAEAPTADGAKVLGGAPPSQEKPPAIEPRPNMPMAPASVAAAPEPPKPKAIYCNPPNASVMARAVLARPGMDEKLKRLCRNGTDWTYLDVLIDELRKKDRRWGYFCRRGRCNDPSHDVLAYYCGAWPPVNGDDDAVGIDFVVASCRDPGDGATPSIGWGVFGANDQGVPAWTTRGRFQP